jgi:hypothetical protein
MGAAGVEAILTELIRIDSVNTRLAADGGGEAEIAALDRAVLRRAWARSRDPAGRGLRPERSRMGPGS